MHGSNGGIGETCRKATRPDPTHLRRSGFRQQVSASVRRRKTVTVHGVSFHAKDNAVLVVRWQSRRSSELLYFRIQEFKHPKDCALPRRLAWAAGSERCRADALLIRVKTVQSEPFFANTANAPLSSQLDIIQERGGRAMQGDGVAVP